MDDSYKEIVEKDIAPMLQSGDLTLFLGAGVSIGNETLNGLGVPSSTELVSRICIEAGYSEDDAKETDLPTAFGVGEDEIDNFDNFLISNFIVIKGLEWQKNIFKHWWRCIFTTNIDTMPEACIENNKKSAKEYPNYQFFNYLDREPVVTIPTSPAIVFLHGIANKVKEGFVFDNVSYARNTVKQSDWINKCALHISHGNCLFVGSKFKESDIEAAIRQREFWDKNRDSKKTNWIVLKKFSNLEKKSYLKRGITPIEAKAEDFFNFLFSKVEYLSPTKFIRRKAPHLSKKTTNESAAWFSVNMENVSTSLENAKKQKGPFSRFYFGDMPDWFYIANNVPAYFSTASVLEAEILEFEKSDKRAIIIPILGPLCSGKTTISMIVAASLAKTHNNIYKFSGIDGIDIGKTWNVVKDLKGLVLIFIDSSSEYFYAINEIIDNVLTLPTSCKLCFLIEERSIHFDRNKRHLFKIPQENQKIINIGNLNKANAETLYDKALDLGIKFEKMEGQNREQSVNQIIDFESGYKGDLLATLYELSYRNSYHEKLAEEYQEIIDLSAKTIYQTISIVTASRLSIPINYLAEVHGFSINNLAKLLKGELKGKTYSNYTSMTISARHHAIAEFHIENSFKKEELKDCIIELMKCVATKFSIGDIKKHPISYKIYSKILSFHYLTEIIFKNKDQYHFIHEIYSTCQSLFSKDGIFWLQYGRFLERDKDINNAVHCFKKGLNLYDSFQIRHALGQILLKRFRVLNYDIDDFHEGLSLLRNEIDSRGETDAYPYTALGNELIKICHSPKTDTKTLEFCIGELKEIVNRGVNIHKKDQYFMKMLGRYIKLKENIQIS